MSNVEIRAVKTGDEKALAYIQTESWKKAFCDILSQEDLAKYANVDKAEAMYIHLLKNNIGNGVLLSVDGKPHCIAFWDATREPDMSGYAELICIHSLQDNWGKGYGSIVMEYVTAEMKKSGFEKVMLWVFEENHRARKFYEKHGFVLSGKSKKFNDAVEVMYWKAL